MSKHHCKNIVTETDLPCAIINCCCCKQNAIAMHLVVSADLCINGRLFVSALISYARLNYTIASLNFIHKRIEEELENIDFTSKNVIFY